MVSVLFREVPWKEKIGYDEDGVQDTLFGEKYGSCLKEKAPESLLYGNTVDYDIECTESDTIASTDGTEYEIDWESGPEDIRSKVSRERLAQSSKRHVRICELSTAEFDAILRQEAPGHQVVSQLYFAKVNLEMRKNANLRTY